MSPVPTLVPAVTEARNLSDSDLLGVVTGNARAARAALRCFADLHAVLRAPAAELGRLPGSSPRVVARIQAVAELAVRYRSAPLTTGQAVHSAKEVLDAFGPQLADEKREVFVAIALDVKNRVIGQHVVSIGHLTSALVHPREVFKEAIRESAAALIVAHNHPSRDPEPSREDIDITRRLAECGRLLGIPLLDHVVIAGEAHVSMAERGLT